MNLKLKLCTLLCLGFGSLFTPPNIQAELLKTENFEYEANSLNTLPAEAGWIQATAKTVTENIDLVEQPLSYSGYHETAVGKAVHFVSAESQLHFQCNRQYGVYFCRG